MRTFAAFLLLCFSAPVCAGASAWFPLEIKDGMILMDVTINGEPAKAMLDTGSYDNGVSENYLASHVGEYTRGKFIEIQGIKEDYQTNEINRLKVGIFGSEVGFDNLVPMRVDVADIIIGLRFFELFVVQIDYPGKRMRIVDHDSLDMRKFSNVKMRFSTSSFAPMVRVNLNGEDEVWLDLDTGNSSGVFVPRNKAERNGWLKSYSTKPGSLVGASGAVASTEMFKLPTMTVGPFELEDVEVTVPAEGEHLYLTTRRSIENTTGSHYKRGKKSDGQLGYDVLKHFVVSLDYKREFVNFDLPR